MDVVRSMAPLPNTFGFETLRSSADSSTSSATTQQDDEPLKTQANVGVIPQEAMRQRADGLKGCKRKQIRAADRGGAWSRGLVGYQ